MAHKSGTLVLDSWSIIAYLEDEPAGREVANLLAEAHEKGTRLVMTVVNAGEVWYILSRATSETEADKSIQELCELGIELIEANWKLAREAARFKANYKMSFADGFAAALASVEPGSVLLTGDKEFRHIEDRVKVHWLTNESHRQK